MNLKIHFVFRVASAILIDIQLVLLFFRLFLLIKMMDVTLTYTTMESSLKISSSFQRKDNQSIISINGKYLELSKKL